MSSMTSGWIDFFYFLACKGLKKTPCIYVWIARWKGSYFEGSPTWPFPDEQLGVHLPPSQSLGPHFLMSLASRENRKTEQHVNVSRSTNHTASFWKVSFRLLGIFWNGGQMREFSKGVPKWTKKEILKQLFKCYCKCLRECLMIFAVIRCYALCRYSMRFLMQKEFQVGQEFDF